MVQAAQKTMIRHIDAGAAGARAQEGGGAGSDSAVDGGDGSRREVCEQLLRRQQARIEELERRLMLPAVAASASTTGVDVAYAGEGSDRPTLTI